MPYLGVGDGVKDLSDLVGVSHGDHNGVRGDGRILGHHHVEVQHEELVRLHQDTSSAHDPAHSSFSSI